MGAAVLKHALQREFNYKRLFLILGIMADKDIKGIISALAPIADTVILTCPKTERAASLEMLYKEIMDLRGMYYRLHFYCGRGKGDIEANADCKLQRAECKIEKR